ncbi:dephospho-CoA kinase domain-containing protein isoform X3 [Gorilla gorilla gorilla]|uniref:dephospho-CoA kinase domain-containing protein isoform X3 n=1 Tax=Gorilla gorilla gorilla TaxID=9595 RepID=UPI003009E5E1
MEELGVKKPCPNLCAVLPLLGLRTPQTMTPAQSHTTSIAQPPGLSLTFLRGKSGTFLNLGLSGCRATACGSVPHLGQEDCRSFWHSSGGPPPSATLALLSSDSVAPGSVVSRTALFPGKMFLVGLTGGIASGKSSVIQVFQQLGCAVIDVDVMARHVVQPGYPAHRRIVEVFGTEVLLENGDINRKVLGDLIFNQPDRRQLLNAITHPEIRKQMMKETFKYFLRVSKDLPPTFQGQHKCQPFYKVFPDQLSRNDFLQPSVLHSIGTGQCAGIPLRDSGYPPAV